MDWLWRALGYNDPLRDIDPTLREFLKSQSPKTYSPSTSPSSPPQQQQQQQPSSSFPSSSAPDTYKSQIGLQSPNPNFDPLAPTPQPSTPRPLPRESLFQDGRYAHLWSSYRPQSEIEAAGKSDQEKLDEITSAWKERQAQVSRAALENCADQQFALHDCFANGSWRERGTMCRDQSRALQRCVVLQGKFLRALGFMSMYERSEAETERLQMHADTLYQRMIKYEKDVEEAKAAGLPEPPFPTSSTTTLPTSTSTSQNPSELESQSSSRQNKPRITLESLPPALREKLTSQRFAGLSGAELDLAKAELEQELAWNEEANGRLQDFYIQQRKEMWAREQAGTTRLGDRVTKAFDLRDWAWLERREEEEKKRRKGEGE